MDLAKDAIRVRNDTLNLVSYNLLEFESSSACLERLVRKIKSITLLAIVEERSVRACYLLDLFPPDPNNPLWVAGHDIAQLIKLELSSRQESLREAIRKSLDKREQGEIGNG